MRVSPLGIFGARGYDLAEVSRWAAEDAALTHPNAMCVEANMLSSDAQSGEYAEVMIERK